MRKWITIVRMREEGVLPSMPKSTFIANAPMLHDTCAQRQHDYPIEKHFQSFSPLLLCFIIINCTCPLCSLLMLFWSGLNLLHIGDNVHNKCGGEGFIECLCFICLMFLLGDYVEILIEKDPNFSIFA